MKLDYETNLNMIFIFYIVLTESLLTVNLKSLSSQNCEIVFSELSLQGFSFEEKIELQKIPSRSRLCLPIPSNNVGNNQELSCCSLRNEMFLMSFSTDEYLKIVRKQLKLHHDKLKDLEIRYFELHQTVIEILISNLNTLILPLKDQQQQYQIGIITKRFGKSLLLYLNNSYDNQSLKLELGEFITKVLHIVMLKSCENEMENSANFKMRRAKHSIQRFDDNPNLLQNNRIKSPKISQLLHRALDDFIADINSTRFLISCFKISISILNHLNQCRNCSLSRDCSINIFRMYHCAYCAGQVFNIPCFSVCLEVINQCLSNFQSIAGYWKEIFEKLETRFEGLKNGGDILDAVQNFYSKLLKTFSMLQTESQKDSRPCIRQSYNRKMDNTKKIFSDSVRTSSRTLYQIINNEARRDKLLWQELATSICKMGSWVSSLSNADKCWNGSTSSSLLWQKCTFCKSKGINEQVISSSESYKMDEIHEILQKFIYDNQIYYNNEENNQKPFNDTMELLFDKSPNNESIMKMKPEKYYEEQLNVLNLKDLDRNNFLVFPDFENSSDKTEGSGFKSDFRPDVGQLQSQNIREMATTNTRRASKMKEAKNFLILINLSIILRLFFI